MLQNPLYHYPHQTVAEFLSAINHYTNIRAKELYKKKASATWFTIILYPITKFVLNYILRLGFLDGWQGYYIAWSIAFATATRYAKVKEARAMRNSNP